MQILPGWTRQRLSKSTIAKGNDGTTALLHRAALRTLSRKNIVLRLEDKQWTYSHLVQENERDWFPSSLFSFSSSSTSSSPSHFPHSTNASLAFSVCSTNKPFSKGLTIPLLNATFLILLLYLFLTRESPFLLYLIVDRSTIWPVSRDKNVHQDHK